MEQQFNKCPNVECECGVMIKLNIPKKRKPTAPCVERIATLPNEHNLPELPNSRNCCIQHSDFKYI